MKWKSKTSPPFSLAVALFRVSSLSSAAEVLDDDAGEKRDGVEVGFGFGDSDDFGSAAYDLTAAPRETIDFESVANEAVA